MIARLGKYPNQVLKIAATHLKWWPVLDSWQCIFYGQFWIKKMKYMVFYLLYFVWYFITNSQKKIIWWKHITSLRLSLIFIRFQNDTTLKFNFKRLRKWNSHVPFRRRRRRRKRKKVLQKSCFKMLFYKNATNLQESTPTEMGF